MDLGLSRIAMTCSPQECPVSLHHHQHPLIERNVHSLRQALDLLEQIDDRAYQQSPPGFAPHRIGGHLRHILEFYECFLDGIESRYIDYDARRRDESIERSRGAAMAKVQVIIRRLQSTAALQGDSFVWVRTEDSQVDFVAEPFLSSSIGRELQVLSSHTIHHFALIAMTLKAHGITVSRTFGMAPSTLRYLEERKRHAEAAWCAR